MTNGPSSTSDIATPSALAYGHLTPDVVLDALDAVGLRGDGRVLQLNSYENRVWRVMLEDGGAVVVKAYRPGRWSEAQIEEEHVFTLELATAEVPVMAPLALSSDGVDTRGHTPSRSSTSSLTSSRTPWLTGAHGTLLHWPTASGDVHRLAVSPWLGGRDPDIESDDGFQRLGRLIGRVHAVSTAHAHATFAHRLTLTPALGDAAVDLLLALDAVDDSLRSRWTSSARRALEAVTRAFERHGPHATIRLHGDAHRGNLLARDGILHLVDFDDACNGPAMQDLWLFLDGQDGEDRQRQLRALLAGYEDFMDFDDAQLALIEPLRTLRILRHSAWIAQRWSDPAFPIAFPAFGTPNHWADQITVLDEQLDRMAPG
jgi:Ser/Thr protein kinase RdoA (MazF antagonist)